MPAARPRPRRRALVAALLGLVTTASVLVGAAAPAAASADEVVALVAAERAAAGLPALRTSSDLAAVADRWADQLAESGALAHNPALGQEVSGWSGVAENVGTGADVATVHRALMGSSGHRANILGGHTQVGVGTATGHGAVWVVQVFRTPSGSQPAPDEPAEPPADPSPAAPAPRAADQPEPPAPPSGSDEADEAGPDDGADQSGPDDEPASDERDEPRVADRVVARTPTGRTAAAPVVVLPAWVDRVALLREVGGRSPARWHEPWPC